MFQNNYFIIIAHNHHLHVGGFTHRTMLELYLFFLTNLFSEKSKVVILNISSFNKTKNSLLVKTKKL